MPTITLNTDAPSPVDLVISRGKAPGRLQVTIANATTVDATVSSSPGFFNPEPGTICPGDSVTCTVGDSGSYTYTLADDDKEKRAPRSGTITIKP